MFHFVVKPHSQLHGISMVEVWREKPEADGGGEFVAAIYPEEDGLKLISAYDGLVRCEVEVTRVGDMEKRTRVVNFQIREERIG